MPRPVLEPPGRVVDVARPIAVPELDFPPPTTPPVAGIPDPAPEPGVQSVAGGRAGLWQRRPSAAATSIPSASLLEAHNVQVWFGKRQVLRDVSLRMEPGRVTALIGPSGCGKSTFLRCLNRMHELIPGASLAGSVNLDGVDIYGPIPATTTRLKIGMVFQRPNPFPAMTIAQNVLAGLMLSGVKIRNKDEILETSLRRAGLWAETKNRLHSSGGALSGGQQQRLCIARALAVSPQVLLMDEPCSALDPISTGVIEETITSLKHDVTIVIVTHNMQQALRVSDACALFLVDNESDPGYIVEAGETEEMFATPRDSRTADYITGRFG